MNYSLAQFILVARSRDPDGWMNILVLVIMAVVYGLVTIIRAKGKKSQEQVKEELGRKPARKPATGGGGVLEQFFKEVQRAAMPTQERESRPAGQQAPKKIARPQPAVRKYADEAKPAPQVQPDEALPEFTTKAAEGLVGKRKGMAEVPESEYLSEVLLDYADPDELRMAILHYEILGRPLSLRDPSGQIIGLKL